MDTQSLHHQLTALRQHYIEQLAHVDALLSGLSAPQQSSTSTPPKSVVYRSNRVSVNGGRFIDIVRSAINSVSKDKFSLSDVDAVLPPDMRVGKNHSKRATLSSTLHRLAKQHGEIELIKSGGGPGHPALFAKVKNDGSSRLKEGGTA